MNVRALWRAAFVAAFSVAAIPFVDAEEISVTSSSIGGGSGSPVVVTPFTAGDVLVPNSSGQVVDASTLVGGQGYAVSPVGINLTGNLTLTGAAGPTQAGVYQDITVGGTSTSTSGWQSYWFLHAVDSATANGNTPLSGLDVRVQLTGSIGLRNAIESYLSIDTQPNAADASFQNYVSMSALGYTQASAKSGLVGGATFAGYAGSLWGANPDVFTATGAVHWMGLYGEEDDTNIIGGDVAERYDIFSVHQGTTLAVIDDAGMEFTGNYLNGIEFGGVRHGYLSTGTLISGITQSQGTGSPRAPTAAIGIDLRAFTFTTMAFESAGFSVDPTGQESALNIALTGTTCATNTYFYLVVSGVLGVCDAGAAAAAFRGVNGTFFNRTNAINTGDILATNNSSNSRLGFTLLNTNTGTAATTVLTLGNSAGNAEANITLNGGAFSGGQGANALVISNTGATPIVIGAGTETLKFGSSGMFAANGAVATTVTSLGPTGSHTTIQGWTTFFDNAGTQRWQPYY